MIRAGKPARLGFGVGMTDACGAISTAYGRRSVNWILVLFFIVVSINYSLFVLEVVPVDCIVARHLLFWLEDSIFILSPKTLYL